VAQTKPKIKTTMINIAVVNAGGNRQSITVSAEGGVLTYDDLVKAMSEQTGKEPHQFRIIGMEVGGQLTDVQEDHELLTIEGPHPILRIPQDTWTRKFCARVTFCTSELLPGLQRTYTIHQLQLNGSGFLTVAFLVGLHRFNANVVFCTPDCSSHVFEYGVFGRHIVTPGSQIFFAASSAGIAIGIQPAEGQAYLAACIRCGLKWGGITVPHVLSVDKGPIDVRVHATPGISFEVKDAPEDVPFHALPEHFTGTWPLHLGNNEVLIKVHRRQRNLLLSMLSKQLGKIVFTNRDAHREGELAFTDAEYKSTLQWAQDGDMVVEVDGHRVYADASNHHQTLRYIENFTGGDVSMFLVLQRRNENNNNKRSNEDQSGDGKRPCIDLTRE